MAKITLDTILSSFASTSLYNTNFSAIEDEFNDKVLYRDNPMGEANEMMNDLDMNSNDIINCGDIDTTTLSVGGVEILAASDVTEKTFTETEFTNVATQDTFSVTYTPGLLVVILNGVELAAADFTATNGTSVVLATPIASASDVLKIRAFQGFVSADHLQKSLNLSDLTDTAAARSNLGVGGGTKNLIINGDMSVWQRGTTTFTPASGTPEYTADRWLHSKQGSNFFVDQIAFAIGQTDVPNNPEFYIRNDTVSIAGAANFTMQEQRIESVSKLSGETVTLSFWAKSNTTQDISTEFVQNFGTGGSPSADVNTLGVTKHALTTTWTKYTATVTLPSVSGKTLGTDGNDFTSVNFWFDAGSDFDSRTDTLGQASGQVCIANVQVESGSQATEFEFVSPHDQLAECKRYFHRLGFGSSDTFLAYALGFAVLTTRVEAELNIPVEMRAAPTAIITTPTAFSVSDGAAATALTALTLRNSSRSTASLRADVAAGLTQFRPYRLELAVVGSGFIDLDAEL